MAIVQSTPDMDLRSDIYAALNDANGAPALMPRVAVIMAEAAAQPYRTCITFGSILIGMAVACVGFLLSSPAALGAAAVAFVVTALAVALWGQE